jgi:hypothetical protein
MSSQGYRDGFAGRPKSVFKDDPLYEIEYNQGAKDGFQIEKYKADKEQADLKMLIADEKRRREEDIRMRFEFENERKKDEEFQMWMRSQPEQKQINISPTIKNQYSSPKEPSAPQPQQQKLQIVFRDEKPWYDSPDKFFSHIEQGFKKFTWLHWVLIVLWFAFLSYIFEFKLK